MQAGSVASQGSQPACNSEGKGNGSGALRERMWRLVGPSSPAKLLGRTRPCRTPGRRLPRQQRFFIDGPAGKPHFDLESFVVASLADAGIARIEALGLDTYADPARFFSYRRATHAGVPDSGRQLSLIGLAPAQATS